MSTNDTNEKRRILIFSTAYFPFVAGAEVSIREITDRLSSQYDFDLITGRFDKNLPSVEKIGSINVYRVGKGRPLWDKLSLPFSGAVLAWRYLNLNIFLGHRCSFIFFSKPFDWPSGQRQFDR